MSAVAAHGGELVDRVVDDARAAAITAAAPAWPRIVLDARATADALRIAIGAYSPLTGFVDARDRAAIAAEGRLASGAVWPVAITLTVDATTAATLAIGAPAGLWTRAGALLGALTVRELAALADATAVAGDLELVPAAIPAGIDTPRALRAAIAAHGWRRVAGHTVAGVFGRADEHLGKLALATTDGLVILRLAEAADRVSTTAARLGSAEVVARGYFPGERVEVATIPGGARPGAEGALLAALVAKNYGVGQPIVVDDGGACLCDRFAARDLGLAPLRYAPVAWCPRCEDFVSARSCPHAERQPAQVDDAVLADPARLAALVRPEVAQLLDRAPAAAPATWPAPTRGFVLWFTGLSGAGKSTLAAAVARALRGAAPIEILDGDEVRTHLSNGLSFSRADRDINVHRIAFVARTLARHGVGVITAAISPYADTRAEIRALAAARGIPFIEVYARAQLAALVARDVKGLYRQALAGELAHFTGVSDPYEPPTAPEVEVATDRDTIDHCAATIVGALHARGLLGGRPAPHATLTHAGA